jgi:hypothetical protein
VAYLIFVVSRDAPQTYSYLKHVFADGMALVVLDRRVGDRRRSQSWRLAERRHAERRRHDVTPELQSSGWAVVPRA